MAMSAEGGTDPLTRGVKELAVRHGAALVGVSPVERFDPMPPLSDAPPPGHHPRDFLPSARSVISIAQPILQPVLDAPAVLAERDLEMIPEEVRRPYFEVFYNRVGHVVHDFMLEFIGQVIGQHLLARGYQTMIFPTTGLHPKADGLTEREVWEGAADGRGGSPFGYTFGPFSHRHAATRAGLGEFGYNNLVLTRQYGPRQRFNSIVTEAELTPDPLIDEPICLRGDCMLCIKGCVAECITLRNDADIADDRSVDGLDDGGIFIDTPARTDPKLCSRRREGRTHAPIRGDCVRICPVPEMPQRLPGHLQRLAEEYTANPPPESGS
jgi:ferredoxin